VATPAAAMAAAAAVGLDTAAVSAQPEIGVGGAEVER